ncbi:hypothetical protein LOZ53_000812 [Ophidiomyces ophidiicola]|nr:hypothetical protein LOZ53_000812 [Ophidiomyces ophidiicola]
MKVLAVSALLALAMPALAQDVTSLPQCAQTTVLQSISSTNCGLTDIKCICNNRNFVNSLLEKIPKVCNPEEVAKASQVAVELCAAYGATLSLPGVGPSTTAAASSPAGSSPAATTPAPSSTGSASHDHGHGSSHDHGPSSHDHGPSSHDHGPSSHSHPSSASHAHGSSSHMHSHAMPTGTSSRPSGPGASATASASPTFTGAAVANKAGLGIAGLMALVGVAAL